MNPLLRRNPTIPMLMGFVCLGLIAVASPARAGVTVAILPETTAVAPGATFDVSISVPVADSAFNAFSVIVTFDPAALTPVPMSPTTNQIGSSMKAACGNEFHVFKSGASADTAECSMLCGGVTMRSGEIYKLRFTAANTNQQTTLSFGTVHFYNAGIYVLPVTAHGAVVRIGTVTAVGASPSPARLSLAVGPNPAHGRTTFAVQALAAGSCSLSVLDLQGRTVRRFGVAAGARSVTWDGLDRAGAVVAPGIYEAVLTQGVHQARVRVTLVR